MIDTVIFDLDGTLLDRDASVSAFAREQHRPFNDALGHIPETVYLKRFVDLDAHGFVWKDEVYRRLVAEFQVELIDAGRLLDDYVTCFRDHCIPFVGMHAMLERLRARGLALGIISNGRTVLQMATVRALGIESHMGTILLSESEGVRKPDPAIFWRAVAQLGTTVDRAVYVGDNPVADVAGAREAGLRAIWKRNPFWPPPVETDAAIDDLGDLLDVIERLAATSPRQP